MITCKLRMDDAHGDECWWLTDSYGKVICECFDKDTAIKIAKLLEPESEPIIQAASHLVEFFAKYND